MDFSGDENVDIMVVKLFFDSDDGRSSLIIASNEKKMFFPYVLMLSGM